VTTANWNWLLELATKLTFILLFNYVYIKKYIYKNEKKDKNNININIRNNISY